jgi:hypothetical protein
LDSLDCCWWYSHMPHKSNDLRCYCCLPLPLDSSILWNVRQLSVLGCAKNLAVCVWCLHHHCKFRPGSFSVVKIRRILPTPILILYDDIIRHSFCLHMNITLCLASKRLIRCVAPWKTSLKRNL